MIIIIAENKTFLTLIKIPINATSIGYRPEYTGARSDGSSTPLHLCPDYSDKDMTNVTMAILVQPTITSKLTPKQAFESDNVILHALLSDILTTTLQYWIITSYIITTLTQY